MKRQKSSMSHSFEVASFGDNDELMISHIKPALRLQSRHTGNLVIDKLCYVPDAPLLVMPMLNGEDCRGQYFRMDLAKGPQAILDKPPVPLNKNALKAISHFCHAVLNQVRETTEDAQPDILAAPHFRLEN